MTPLAQRFVRQMIGDPSDAILPDLGNEIPLLLEAHCFEISAIYPAVIDLLADPKFSPDDLTSSFLPAPKTWIEWLHDDGVRHGLLLIEEPNRGERAFTFLVANSNEGMARWSQSWDTRMHSVFVVRFIATVLAMINTPKIIGRRQHMPHRGLEKRLLARRPNIGKFPLQAWTEILLHVSPPKDASAAEPIEAHLTGSKALHFCRAHLRIRLGQLERVRAHWRGDPSLGIKRSRYKVAA